MTFRIEPLSRSTFQPLFALDDEALVAIGARRMVVEKLKATPCRISLADAEPGETVLLVHHDHLTDPQTPYRAGAAIYVRQTAEEATPMDAAPDMLTRRLLSVRVFDRDWMMMEADVLEGSDLDARLTDWFANPRVGEVHIHAARQGCYLAKAVPAT